MSIHHMTRPQLIAKMERDQAAVSRAAALIADNARLVAEVAALKAQAQPREVIKEVPGPVRTVVKVKEVPGPTRTITKTKEVPGPVRTVTKEVPTPCPKQAKEIAALKRKLDSLGKYDMQAFKKWCKMVDAASVAE